MMGRRRSYLGPVHSDQALVDFGPGRNSTDVPQLVGVFSKRAGLHLRIKERRRDNSDPSAATHSNSNK